MLASSGYARIQSHSAFVSRLTEDDVPINITDTLEASFFLHFPPSLPVTLFQHASDADMNIRRPEARVKTTLPQLLHRLIQRVWDVVWVQELGIATAFLEQGRVNAFGNIRTLEISHEPG
jgi:hypothetical protein